MDTLVITDNEGDALEFDGIVGVDGFTYIKSIKNNQPVSLIEINEQQAGAIIAHLQSVFALPKSVISKPSDLLPISIK